LLRQALNSALYKVRRSNIEFSNNLPLGPNLRRINRVHVRHVSLTFISILSFHLCSCIPCCIFPRFFPTKILQIYVLLIPLMLAACLVHLVHLHIIIMALQLFVGPWLLFQFLDPIQSRYDSSDGGSVRRKASTYIQNYANIE
jgi:hypothetical protein